MTPLDEVVRATIRRHGPRPFDEVMATALYDDAHGFYTAGGRAGRGGDFITSPEVGPLFGAVVARALDAEWAAAGRPAVFVVVDAGAGPGTLARAVLGAQPACAPALRYVLVEPSPAQRAIQASRLPLEHPSAAFAAVPDEDEGPPGPPPPDGPIVVSLPELPRPGVPSVVLANELLDNLPFAIAERRADGWAEVHVAVEGDRLVEVLLPLDPEEADRLDERVPGAPPGSRLPLPRGAVAWLRDALAVAGAGGCVLALDYAARAAHLAALPTDGWLRTYRGHARGGAPLEALGTQDITADVPVDLLVPPPASDRTQAEWLRAHGIDALVEEGRRIWQERAALGDLEAVRARSRIGEAEALTDPAGLGAFRVLEWRP